MHWYSYTRQVCIPTIDDNNYILIFMITFTDRISVNASKYYYSIGDEEGSTLSCTLAQQNSSAQELNWHKNGYQVMTTNSSSILYINISDTVEKLDFVNEYGTYTCTAMEMDGRQSSKSIHVAEKGKLV